MTARGQLDASPIPVARKFAYAAVLLLAALTMVEGTLRLRARIRYGSSSSGVRDPMLTYDKDAQLYVPKPGYEVKGARIHIKVNALGFRGDEITRQKPRGTVRVACLGASTTFCTEVSSNHATWPHRLQEKLQAAYPDVTFQVINASVPGYVAADSLKALEHRVLPLDPDVVMYYEANNEIVRDTRDLAVRTGLVTVSQHPPSVAWLSKYSLLFDLAYKNVVIRTAADSARPKLDRIPPDLPDHFVSLLDRMRIELTRREIPLVLSTFLVKYRRGQDRQIQIANADVAFYYMPWMSIDGMLQAMDVYNSAIVHYARLHALPIVDDREAIPPDAEHYTDCMHFSDRGAEAMAERFYRYFREAGVVERAVEKARASSRR